MGNVIFYIRLMLYLHTCNHILYLSIQLNFHRLRNGVAFIAADKVLYIQFIHQMSQLKSIKSIELLLIFFIFVQKKINFDNVPKILNDFFAFFRKKRSDIMQNKVPWIHDATKFK